jgi:tetratricopeptide (TPR) repeat protein
MAKVPETPEFLLKQADETFNANRYDEAEGMYERARVSARDAGNLSVEIEATAQRARCNLTQDRFDSAKAWLDRAKAIAAPEQPSGWARYLGVKGRWEWRNGRSEAAVPIFVEMYDFATAHKLYYHQVDAAHMVAIVAPLDQQEEWALKGIKDAEASSSTRWLGPLWNNLGGTYCDLKRYDDAVNAYKEAREYHWRFGSEMNKFWADYSVGYALRLEGKFDEAMTWLSPCLAWAQRLGDHDAIGSTDEQIGDVMAARGNKKDALQYYQKALEQYKAAGFAESSPKLISDLQMKINALN